MLLPFCCGRLQNSPYFFLHVCLHAWAVKGKFRSEGENRQWGLGETPKIWTVCFSVVKHLPRMSRAALCALQNWFWERKKNSCFAVYCCGQTWNSWNYYYFSLLANKLLNHFEVSNLSFSIFCLSAGGGAAGASLMGAPALLGLLPQGGLIQASKEVGSHHSIKRVEWNIPHKKIPIWSVVYM